MRSQPLQCGAVVWPLRSPQPRVERTPRITRARTLGASEARRKNVVTLRFLVEKWVAFLDRSLRYWNNAQIYRFAGRSLSSPLIASVIIVAIPTCVSSPPPPS